VSAAVFQMQKPGDKAGPVETPKGFEIVKLQNKTVALDKKFDEVKEMVRQRIARERRTKDYDDFIKRLREQGNVKLDDAEIAKLPNPEPGPGMQLPPGHGLPQRPPPVAAVPK
jgi:peptidyl-prolyl cis-trans isomerase C